MVTARFTDYDYARAPGLWQYDYGQLLRIEGLSLDPTVEVHFSIRDTGGEAEIRIGKTENNTTLVEIPDAMLQNDGYTKDYEIYAFIYLTDETSGETIKKITMPVKSRPKPGEETINTPEDQKLFREAIQSVNDAAARAEKAEKDATESEISAEAWAHGHPDYPERDTDNAKYYAERAEQVAAKNGYAAMEIGEDGCLYLTRTTNIAETMNFELNENGELEAIIYG